MDNQSTNTNELTANEPAAKSAPTSIIDSNQTTPLWRDLLLPISIMVAGLCIGLGLFFGLSNTVTQPSGVDKVRPVSESDHIRGAADAPIIVIEYSDFDCPFCGRFHNTMKQVLADNQDVAWVFRHFPLDQLHPQARSVSVASVCVAELAGNDAFWTFADGYFDTRDAGNTTAHSQLVIELADQIGINQAALEECINSDSAADQVRADINNASETGGRGTPWSIIIGPSGKTYPVNGALPLAAIEQLLQLARDEA